MKLYIIKLIKAKRRQKHTFTKSISNNQLIELNCWLNT